MSKKVDTYTRFKDKLQNLFGINKSVPSGTGNKGILKDALLDMASPEINVEWTKEFIPPDKAIIDEDYVLSRYPLAAGIKDLIIYSAQQNIPVLLICEVIGGVPPYTYSWSTPINTTVSFGQNSRGLSATLTAGSGTYSPFRCTVTDSANTTVTAEGAITVERPPTGETTPPDREGPETIITPMPLEVNIRVTTEGYRVLENNPLILVGTGQPIYVHLTHDVTGGKHPYTLAWSVNQDDEGITTNQSGALISLDKGLGIYRIVLSAEDSLGISGHSNGYIYYQDSQGNLETIGSEYLYLPEKCSGKYEGFNYLSIIPASVAFDMGTRTGTCGIQYDFRNKIGVIMVVWDGRVVYFNNMSGAGTRSNKGTITFNKNKSYPTVVQAVFMSDDYYDNNYTQGNLHYKVSGICPSGGYLAPDTSNASPLSVFINNGRPIANQGVLWASGGGGLDAPVHRIMSVPVIVSGGTGSYTITDSIVNQSHPGVFELSTTMRSLRLPKHPPNGAWCTYRVTVQDAITTVSSEVKVTYQERNYP